jgi:ubiquinone/menaquinone biosynthesis C-methylase UbiE
MSLYGRIFAALYDRMMAGTEEAGLRDRRRALLVSAEGRVVEIGAGTGANIALYPSAVSELVLTEPEEPMARRLENRARSDGARVSVQVVRAQAERLPFADDSFDTAVCTLVLCTVHDPEQALREVGRILKPGGRLLFLEHVRSADPRLAKWQDRFAPLWRRMGNGCNCNRATPDLIRARFEHVEAEAGELPKAPPIVRPLSTGSAVAR